MFAELVLESFRTTRNLLNWSVTRRYWCPLNSNRSELSLCLGKLVGVHWAVPSVACFGAFGRVHIFVRCY